MTPTKAFQSLRDFFKESEIEPFAENLNDDDFSPKSLALMSITELQENFMLDEETAKKIYQDLEQFRQKFIKKQPIKKPKKRLSNLFNLLAPCAPSKPTPKQLVSKPTFMNEFEDLSDIIYVDGDDWEMDPCSAANADSYNYFQETYEFERYEKYSNEYGWTPLMYASALNCKEIVSFILSKNNPNLCIQNDEKQTALMIAASFGHVSIIEKFVEYSREKAETSENVKKEFIAETIGLNIVDEGGFTALHYAVFYGHHPTIEYLLQLGSNPNIPDIEGMTPTLMACVDEYQEESLPALIKAGGSLYHCNHDGQNGYEIAKRKSVTVFQNHKPDGKPTLYGSF